MDMYFSMGELCRLGEGEMGKLTSGKLKGGMRLYLLTWSAKDDVSILYGDPLTTIRDFQA